MGLVGITLVFATFITHCASWHRKFFIVAAASVLTLTVRTPFTELLYRFPIPILSTGSPTRMLSILAMSLAVLAAIGWDSLSKNPKNRVRTVVIIGLILAASWVGALLQHASTSVRAMALVSVVFVAMAGSILFIPNKIRGVSVLAVLILELLFAFIKFNPFVPRAFVYPPHPLWEFLRSRNPVDRFWGYGTAHILPNVSTMFRLQSPDGIDPLNLKTYNQFVQGSSNGKLARSFTRTTRSDAGIAPGYGERDLADNTARLRVLDALGVRYIIDRVENAGTAITFPPERFTPVWRQNGWTVFENTKAAPRYFLTHDIRPYQSMEEFETQFFSLAFNPSQTVLVEENSQLPVLTHDPTKEMQLIAYTPTRVTVETNTHTPQLLYISDADDGNWRVSIDTVKSSIIRANWTFRGVMVPAGTHRIEFTYVPRSLIAGLVISSATIAFVLALRRRLA